MTPDITFFTLPRWADIRTWSVGAPRTMRSYFNKILLSLGILAIACILVLFLSDFIADQKELNQVKTGAEFLRIWVVIFFIAALVYGAYNALRLVQACAKVEKNKAICDRIPKTWPDAFAYVHCRLQVLEATCPKLMVEEPQDSGWFIADIDSLPSDVIDEMIRATQKGYDYVDACIQKLFTGNKIVYDERQFMLDARPFRVH